MRETIEYGKIWYIISAFDEKEYAKKLDLLMSKEDHRMRMATKGRESTKRFEPKVIAQQWIELFQHIDSNNLVF